MIAPALQGCSCNDCAKREERARTARRWLAVALVATFYLAGAMIP